MGRVLAGLPVQSSEFSIVDLHLPGGIVEYLSSSSVVRDQKMVTALNSMADVLISVGHTQTKDALVLKLKVNSYVSLYTNDFKYMRKNASV